MATENFSWLGRYATICALCLVCAALSIACERKCPSNYRRVDEVCSPKSATDSQVETPVSIAGSSGSASSVQRTSEAGVGAPATAAGASVGNAGATSLLPTSMPSAAGMTGQSPPTPGIGAGSGAPAQSGASGSKSGTMAGAAAPEGDPVCAGRSGQHICEGPVLHACDSAGNSVQMTACPSEARCLAGKDFGMCSACEPGEVQCMGADLQTCSMRGMFETTETCMSAPLCSATTQSCTPGKCNAGQFSCTSGSLSRCKADLTGFEPVQSCRAELCDAAVGKCNECVPGSARCEGNQLVECTDAGTMMRRACSGATPRCVGEACVQCATSTDCTAAECRVTSCERTTGTCSAPTPAPAGTPCSAGRVCNGEGSCVQCVADDDCDPNEMCMDRMCRARKPLEAGTLGANYRVSLAQGYSFTLRAVYSPGNIGRRPVRVSGASGCSMLGDPSPPGSDPSQTVNPGPRANPTCTIAASTQTRTITVEGTTQTSGGNTATNTLPCPNEKRIVQSGTTLTLGFEDYPEAVLSVADCRDPQIVIDPSP